MSCAFCSIPEIKARTIIHNDLVWAFPTNIPVVPGHVLIAPVRCVASVDQLTGEEWTAIKEMVQIIKKALANALGAQGFNFAWNESKMAGQSVPHLHLHVLPRTEGDTGIYHYEPRQFLYRPGERETSPEEELQAVADLIRSHL